jgi:uncharacterized membrane protein YbhN (UPF0104 family)
VLVARIGTGPFVGGLRLTSPWALLAGLVVTAATTACCAWRWRMVAAALDVRLTWATAIVAIYRSQFLNATLPGGVLGDVDRAVGHGRETGALGRSVRSVVWERTLGQVVQVAATVTILVVLPSPMRTIGLVGLAGGTAALLLADVVGATRSSVGRAAAAVLTDLRVVLADAGTRRGVGLASAGAVAGHLLVFLLAAHVAGVGASPYRLLPLAAVVLLAAAVPANVAGWGPREGVAAWAFAAAGLGATTGVTVSVVYGVISLVATLPGAVVLLAGRRRWSTAARPGHDPRVGRREEPARA